MKENLPLVPESLKFSLPKGWERGFAVAEHARQRAYAPYSNFHVGFALHLKEDDEFIPGSNVENASYGATICAERSAFTAAVSRHGSFNADYGIVVTDAQPPAVPCALCLQVIAELAGPAFLVIVSGLDRVEAVYRLDQLLPHAFTRIPPTP